MKSLFTNPEFQRNFRAQLRPRKMMTVAAICGFLSLSAAYFTKRMVADNESNWMDLLRVVIGAQALILAGGGSIACLTNVFREKERNSFDFQRVSGLTAWDLAVGKLFGAPVLMYFICLCLMPLSLLAAALSSCRPSFYLAAYAVLMVTSLAFHALGLLMSVLAIRGSQTGAIVLLLLMLWVTSYGGSISKSSLYQLSPMGPIFSTGLVAQTTWRVADLEKTFDYGRVVMETNEGMTDVLFGKHMHHFPVLFVIDGALAFWFMLAVRRNIKRDPEEYEAYSPGQSLGFALFLSLIFIGFFNWGSGDALDGSSFLVTLNLGMLTLLGLTLLRNRQRLRRAVKRKAGRVSWLDEPWPAPWLLGAVAGTSALIVASAVGAHVTAGEQNLRFLLLRLLFVALWLMRDQQYLQWMSLRRGRNPLVMGVLYLVIFYACTATLFAAFGLLREDRLAFSALLLPTPIYALDSHVWGLRPAIWVTAYVLQVVFIAGFIRLQRNEIISMAAMGESAAPGPAAWSGGPPPASTSSAA